MSPAVSLIFVPRIFLAYRRFASTPSFSIALSSRTFSSVAVSQGPELECTGVFDPLAVALTKPAFTRFLNKSDILPDAEGADVEGCTVVDGTGVDDDDGILAWPYAATGGWLGKGVD